MSADDYGDLYFGVANGKKITQVMADGVSVSSNGDLMFINHGKTAGVFYGLIIASGSWTSCMACSVIDGHAITIDSEDEK